jgi:hypothetical protein
LIGERCGRAKSSGGDEVENVVAFSEVIGSKLFKENWISFRFRGRRFEELTSG